MAHRICDIYLLSTAPANETGFCYGCAHYLRSPSCSASSTRPTLRVGLSGTVADEVMGRHPDGYIPSRDCTWFVANRKKATYYSPVPESGRRVGYPEAGRVHAVELSISGRRLNQL